MLAEVSSAFVQAKRQRLNFQLSSNSVGVVREAMFCRSCREQIADDSNYCDRCGEPVYGRTSPLTYPPPDMVWEALRELATYWNYLGLEEWLSVAYCVYMALRGEYEARKWLRGWLEYRERARPAYY